MTKQEFIEKHKEDTKGYCPCVVDYEGNVYECPKGHLEALMELGREKNLLLEIPTFTVKPKVLRTVSGIPFVPADGMTD